MSGYAVPSSEAKRNWRTLPRRREGSAAPLSCFYAKHTAQTHHRLSKQRVKDVLGPVYKVTIHNPNIDDERCDQLEPRTAFQKYSRGRITEAAHLMLTFTLDIRDLPRRERFLPGFNTCRIGHNASSDGIVAKPRSRK